MFVGDVLKTSEHLPFFRAHERNLASSEKKEGWMTGMRP